MAESGFKDEEECARARDAVARQFYPHHELNFPEASAAGKGKASSRLASTTRVALLSSARGQSSSSRLAPARKRSRPTTPTGTNADPMEEVDNWEGETEADDDIPERFRRHLAKLSKQGEAPKGHPGMSRFPYIRWHDRKWKGELCLEGSEVSRVNKTFSFSSSTEEGAAKLWDKLARVARDKYGLKGCITDFSEREMNFSPDGHEHHACERACRHTRTRAREHVSARLHACAHHTHTNAHRQNYQ